MKRKVSVVLLLSLLLLLLVLPVQAEAQLNYVTDAAGLLSQSEWTDLETVCAQVSEQYDCGVYVVTVDDFTQYGIGGVYEVTYGIYHDYALGMGSERNGIILLLSMAERDYAMFVYGPEAEYAFDSYGQLTLEEEFLPLFGEDDWYGGFCAYAQTCGRYLGQAAAGEPVRESPVGLILLFVGISFFVALLVVSFLKNGMKNVRHQAQAAAYVSGALDLTARHDQFTHITETRRKIESNSGSSSAHSGGGGSGRSGKF